MTNDKKQNPWNLTPRQCATLDALAEHGSYKGAARALGLSTKTVDNYLDAVTDRMGAADRKDALRMWAAYRRPSTTRAKLTATMKAHINAVLCFNLGRALGRAA